MYRVSSTSEYSRRWTPASPPYWQYSIGVRYASSAGSPMLMPQLERAYEPASTITTVGGTQDRPAAAKTDVQVTDASWTTAEMNSLVERMWPPVSSRGPASPTPAISAVASGHGSISAWAEAVED